MSYSMISRSLRAIIRIPKSTRSFSKNPTPRHPSPRPIDATGVTETLNSYFNDWSRALDFFNWVESPESGFTHTTQTFNKMIDILGKSLEFDKSWDLIRRMNQTPDTKPDYDTFRNLFKRYVSAHLVKEAVDTYNRLDEFGLKDETSYFMLIDSLCEYRHVVEAQDLCFWNNVDGDVHGYANTTKICNMILRGWAKVGWYSKCREFWFEMDKRGFEKTVLSYSIYMDIMCKFDKPWLAVSLYKEMQRKRMKLDVVACNIVVKAVGLSDGVDCAIRAVKEMRESGVEPNTSSYNIVVKMLCEANRYSDAYNVLDEMRRWKCEPDLVTYHCMMAPMANPQKLMDLFEKMVESGVRPRVDTFVMLMKKFGRWGFLRPLMEVWGKMEGFGCSPNDTAYNVLIDALVDKNLLDLAKRYEDEMCTKGLCSRRRFKEKPDGGDYGSGDA